MVASPSEVGTGVVVESEARVDDVCVDEVWVDEVWVDDDWVELVESRVCVDDVCVVATGVLLGVARDELLDAQPASTSTPMLMSAIMGRRKVLVVVTRWVCDRTIAAAKDLWTFPNRHHPLAARAPPAWCRRVVSAGDAEPVRRVVVVRRGGNLGLIAVGPSGRAVPR